MPLEFKYTPQCNCCPRDCGLWLDNFDTPSNPPSNWTKQIGNDWQIIGGSLRTGLSNAVCLLDLPHPDGNAPVYVRTNYQCIEHQQIRVIICWLDDDNYYYAQLESGIASNQINSSHISLFSRVAGVETLLGKQSCAWNGFGIIDMWHDGEFLVCKFQHDSGLPSRYIWVEQPLLGNRVGVGTGTITAFANFDNFQFNRAKTFEDENPTCSEFQQPCRWWLEQYTQPAATTPIPDSAIYTGSWAMDSTYSFDGTNGSLKCTAAGSTLVPRCLPPISDAYEGIFAVAGFGHHGDVVKYYFNDDIYIKLTAHSRTFLGGNPNMTNELYVGGVKVHEMETYNGTDGGTGVGFGYRFCYKDGVLKVYNGQGITHRINITTPMKPKVEVVTLAGAKINFGTMDIAYVGTRGGEAGCGLCPLLCPACADEGALAEYVEVEFTGMSNSGCAGTICTDLNGVWELSPGSGCSFSHYRILNGAEKCGAQKELIIRLYMTRGGGDFGAPFTYSMFFDVWITDGFGTTSYIFSRYSNPSSTAIDCSGAVTLTQADFPNKTYQPFGSYYYESTGTWLCAGGANDVGTFTIRFGQS